MVHEIPPYSFNKKIELSDIQGTWINSAREECEVKDNEVKLDHQTFKIEEKDESFILNVWVLDKAKEELRWWEKNGDESRHINWNTLDAVKELDLKIKITPKIKEDNMNVLPGDVIYAIQEFASDDSESQKRKIEKGTLMIVNKIDEKDGLFDVSDLNDEWDPCSWISKTKLGTHVIIFDYKKGDKIMVQIGSQEEKIEMIVTGIYTTYIVATDDAQTTELKISYKELSNAIDVIQQ